MSMLNLTKVLLQNEPTLRTSQEQDDDKPRDDRHPLPPLHPPVIAPT